MKRLPAAFLALIVLTLAVVGVGCPCTGIINADPSLRWWLFSTFGASKICPEMLKRGVPLKFQSMGSASVGRFFPQTCSVQVMDQRKTIVMNTTGTGYAFFPVARRVGFYAGLSIEFGMDFKFADEGTYVWGRYNQMVAPPDLRLQGVENPVINLASQTPIGNIATVLGGAIVRSELAKGFTVLRSGDGDEFAMGNLQPPERPKRHFKTSDDNLLLASDLAEVHASSREYVGPITVESGGSALHLKFRITGAPLEFALVDKMNGEMWRQPYERGLPIGPPPGPPMTYGPLPLGDTKRTINVQPGVYYLVIENRAVAPIAAPVPLFEATGYAAYNIELGDRP